MKIVELAPVLSEFVSAAPGSTGESMMQIVNNFCVPDTATSPRQVARTRQKILHAVNGSFDQCFSKMPEFCEVFERDNPGSFASVQTDDAGHFESIFFGFRAVVEVLKTSGLPDFAIDGAHFQEGEGVSVQVD